jgi:hypothetical protein
LKKSVDTLVTDIYAIFETDPDIHPDDIDQFGKSLAETVAARIGRRDDARGFHLRMSNLGRPDRQLWYQKHLSEGREELEPHTRLKFLIGDVWESVLLFLAKVSGHEVTHEQAEVKLDGIVGHIDGLIDGTVVDVKSASTHAFRKFKDGTLADDDPFGYDVEQISGYATALGTDGAFLAGDKQNGHIALHKVSKDEIEAIDIKGRIEHIKRVLDEEQPPERCYEPVPEGESGNLRLDTGCSYCPFKHHCWSDVNDGVGLRTFLYSRGPVHMVKVVKEPKVMELTF